MLGRFTRIVWACAAVGLTVTIVSYALGMVPRTTDARSGATPSATSASAAEVPATATPQLTSAATAPPTLSATPTSGASATPAATSEATLTPDQLAQDKPNELGEIMVLMYHTLDNTGGDYSTTVEDFRADLQWLYDHDFYVIPIHDYITDSIKAPAGKRPVVLTFDDGSITQFRYDVDATGKKIIDPNCTVGILDDFFTKHPDFGRGGLFSILPLAPFAWPDGEDQVPYEMEKVQWLLDHGFEIGNHTVNHIYMNEHSNAEIEQELADAVDMMRAFDSRAQMEVIAVPFGTYPAHGDTTAFEGFDLNGKHYAFTAALNVGANPGYSPVDSEYDPYWIPRIRGSRDQIDQWFSFAQDNPGIMYVSDGNPDTITVPNNLVPSLSGKLDQSKLDGKTLIRY